MHLKCHTPILILIWYNSQTCLWLHLKTFVQTVENVRAESIRLLFSQFSHMLRGGDDFRMESK